jgi:predicted nucleic acid-binding Zn ribbon protein
MSSDPKRKKNTLNHDQRRANRQKLIFSIIAILLIVSWLLSLVINL